jgi:hypothetical protein
MDRIEIIARALCRDRIVQNMRFDPERKPLEWIQHCEDISWEHFKREGEVVDIALSNHQ